MALDENQESALAVQISTVETDMGLVFVVFDWLYKQPSPARETFQINMKRRECRRRATPQAQRRRQYERHPRDFLRPVPVS